MTKNEKWLSSLKTITDIKVLVKALGLTPQSEISFWRDLLALLRSEKAPIKFSAGEEPVESLMGFITTYADLADEEGEPIISSLYNELKELIYNEENDSFWNQSMQKLIEYFIKNLEQIDDQVLLPIDGDTHDITVGTLREANAGYNLPESIHIGDQWVKPWWNIDNKSYDEVRKCDEVYHILKNQNKMQYTRRPNNDDTIEDIPEFGDWLRLLMPQYGRRVEVEDLDRNFWVIAQTIAAISSYLYDADNPLSKMFEGLTREVSEIWENILYLWTGLAAVTQRQNGEDVINIHLPLQLRDNEHGRKYDNIDEDVDWYSYEATEDGYISVTRGEHFDEEVEKRLAYLIEQYADKNLCIVPLIRLDNYKHNFYAAAWYPGIYMYHQGTKEWTVYRFAEIPEKTSKITEETPTREIVISPKYDLEFKVLGEGETAGTRFIQHLYASKQAKEECIYYSSPFSKTNKTVGDISRFLLYGCIRTSTSYSNCKATPNGFTISRLDIDIYDAAKPLIKENQVGFLGYFKAQKTENNIIYMEYSDYNLFVDEQLQVSCVNPTAGYSGYYMGEVASWKAKTISERQSSDLFNNIAHVIKIGSYMRSNANTFETAVTQELTHTLMKGNVTERSGSGSSITFYRNKWESYLPEKDSETGTPGESQRELCFSENPEKVACNLVTQSYLAEKGLTAVKEYLKKTNQLSQPCYIATVMGLLPWNNEAELIYWNVGALCHIYHYIPSQASLAEKPDDDSYSTPYGSFEAITLGDVSGKIMEGETELGKIISCNLIKKYDSFFESFSMATGSVYYGAWWRQFQIKADHTESCYCIKTNPGDPDEFISYDVNFSTTFSGTVNYFDNRWSGDVGHVSVFDESAQVGTAKVTINSSGYSQSQADEGFIAACQGVGIPLEARQNQAVDIHDTGFMNLESGTVDFMAIPVGTTEEQVCTHATQATKNWTYS